MRAAILFATLLALLLTVFARPAAPRPAHKRARTLKQATRAQVVARSKRPAGALARQRRQAQASAGVYQLCARSGERGVGDVAAVFRGFSMNNDADTPPLGTMTSVDAVTCAEECIKASECASADYSGSTCTLYRQVVDYYPSSGYTAAQKGATCSAVSGSTMTSGLECCEYWIPPAASGTDPSAGGSPGAGDADGGYVPEEGNENPPMDQGYGDGNGGYVPEEPEYVYDPEKDPDSPDYIPPRK